MGIKYVEGDATEPQGAGNKIIVHCCNNAGKWGAGFVLALSKKWPEPERVFKQAQTYDERRLGRVQFVKVAKDTAVANLFGQDGVRGPHYHRPVRYDAISSGLDAVRSEAERWVSVGGWPATVHMPRIGCGLAGGDWRVIEALIEESLTSWGIHVTVYDLPEQPKEKQ